MFCVGIELYQVGIFASSLLLCISFATKECAQEV